MRKLEKNTFFLLSRRLVVTITLVLLNIGSWLMAYFEGNT